MTLGSVVSTYKLVTLESCPNATPYFIFFSSLVGAASGYLFSAIHEAFDD
jgi:hypothetical protein